MYGNPISDNGIVSLTAALSRNSQCALQAIVLPMCSKDIKLTPISHESVFLLMSATADRNRLQAMPSETSAKIENWIDIQQRECLS